MLKTLTTVASVALPIEERWSIKRCRYAPDGESVGRVCIATGTHGDEMMGQLIVYLVQQRIAAHPDALRGTVDFYPMLNPLGLDIGERMVPSGTRLDMNRAFPGSPDGTPLEYMCYQVIQDMRGADFVLDLHASARNKSELYEVRVSAKEADRLLPACARSARSSSGSIRIRVPSPPPDRRAGRGGRGRGHSGGR
ncbi:MAG: succinylglutamate desuccinylase/aspartoacylase family protein [Christensenellales bacterium]